jgi:GT2 family glycosyltransferase
MDFRMTLKSLEQQTRPPDELIVVDSSETTSVRDFLNSAPVTFAIRYFHTAPGLTYQRNIGLEKSQGDLLFFFDDDVVLKENYLASVEKAFADDPSCMIGAIGGRILNLENVGRKSILYRLKRIYFNTLRFIFLQSDFGNGKFRYSGMPTHPHLQKSSGYIECLSGCCMAFRHQVFNIAQFDENLPGYGQMEDADISKQVLDAGYKIYYEASAVLEHKLSPQNRLRDRKLAEMMVVNYAYLFRKHWPQSWMRRLAFFWTLFGLFILFLHNPSGRRGAVDGIKRVIGREQPGN